MGLKVCVSRRTMESYRKLYFGVAILQVTLYLASAGEFNLQFQCVQQVSLNRFC